MSDGRRREERGERREEREERREERGERRDIYEVSMQCSYIVFVYYYRI